MHLVNTFTSYLQCQISSRLHNFNKIHSKKHIIRLFVCRSSFLGESVKKEFVQVVSHTS